MATDDHARRLLVDAFGRVEHEVERALSGIDAAGLAFRPDAGANSIGWLVWHLTRVQDDHISEIAGQPQAYTANGWADRLGLPPDDGDTGYGHTTEEVAAVGIRESAVLMDYHRAVVARTRAHLDTVTGEDLDRVIDTRWDPPVTVAVRLVSVISDCLQHVGAANYLRGLLPDE